VKYHLQMDNIRILKYKIVNLDYIDHFYGIYKRKNTCRFYNPKFHLKFPELKKTTIIKVS